MYKTTIYLSLARSPTYYRIPFTANLKTSEYQSRRFTRQLSIDLFSNGKILGRLRGQGRSGLITESK